MPHTVDDNRTDLQGGLKTTQIYEVQLNTKDTVGCSEFYLFTAHTHGIGLAQ